MPKKDELWGRRSGLIHHLALSVLQDNAFKTFENIFINITTRSLGAITSRTAAEIATQITTGLFTPLYQQINPLRVTEARRAVSIASDYGLRLLEGGKNSDRDNLNRLITVYPSHEFIIDRREARTLFDNVRKPEEDELELANGLSHLAHLPSELHDPFIAFLSLNTSNNGDQTQTTTQS